jgi:hypothetical protein
MRGARTGGQSSRWGVDLQRAAVSPLFASTGRVEGASGAAGSANYAVRVGDPARWAAALASGLIAAGVCVSLRAIPGGLRARASFVAAQASGSTSALNGLSPDGRCFADMEQAGSHSKPDAGILDAWPN